jgi:hypothetical protein
MEYLKENGLGNKGSRKGFLKFKKHLAGSLL